MVPTKVTQRFSIHATQPYCQNKWSKRPRSEAWSPREVLEHVVLMQRYVLLLVGMGLLMIQAARADRADRRRAMGLQAANRAAPA